MMTSETILRVRYGETDQMGYMYYGNYAEYYEVARTDMLRNLGLTYKEIELSGVMMPVLEMRSKYIKPAKYDDLVKIKVIVEHMPTTRIHFKYELYNHIEELINIGETTLVFVNMKTMKPCHPPQNVADCFAPFFEK